MIFNSGELLQLYGWFVVSCNPYIVIFSDKVVLIHQNSVFCQETSYDCDLLDTLYSLTSS